MALAFSDYAGRFISNKVERLKIWSIFMKIGYPFYIWKQNDVIVLILCHCYRDDPVLYIYNRDEVTLGFLSNLKEVMCKNFFIFLKIKIPNIATSRAPMIQTLINMALCFKSRPSQNELGECFSVNWRKQSNLKSNYYIENIKWYDVYSYVCC